MSPASIRPIFKFFFMSRAAGTVGARLYYQLLSKIYRDSPPLHTTRKARNRNGGPGVPYIYNGDALIIIVAITRIVSELKFTEKKFISKNLDLIDLFT